jgi:hypothetical protein
VAVPDAQDNFSRDNAGQNGITSQRSYRNYQTWLIGWSFEVFDGLEKERPKSIPKA